MIYIPAHTPALWLLFALAGMAFAWGTSGALATIPANANGPALTRGAARKVTSRPTQEGTHPMPATVTLVPPTSPEAVRVKKPNRRKGSIPPNVTQLPVPDPDILPAARYLLRQGWTAGDAFHAGLDPDVAAMMLRARRPRHEPRRPAAPRARQG